MPTPTSADGLSAGPRSLPNTSKTHSSPHRSWAASSSNPLIHNAAIERGERSMRAETSTRPPVGSHPSNRSCSSTTTWPSRNRCWPEVDPTGPDQLPDWMPETRSGGAWSPSHQTGWSTGMSRLSPAPSRR